MRGGETEAEPQRLGRPSTVDIRESARLRRDDPPATAAPALEIEYVRAAERHVCRKGKRERAGEGKKEEGLGA